MSGLFGLLYAYVVWNAVTLLAVQAAGPFGLNGLGWTVLGSAVAFPVVVFAVGFGIGWRRKLGPFVLILLCGLALVAVFWLNVLAFAYANGGQLIG